MFIYFGNCARRGDWPFFDGVIRVPTGSGKYGKLLVFFRPGKVWKNIFGLLVWKKKIVFQNSSLDLDFHNSSFKIKNFNFAFILVKPKNFHFTINFQKFYFHLGNYYSACS